jgi:uncharacterized oxidoreductase
MRLPAIWQASMQLSSNTVVVTGGASGIGLALAERFLKASSRVIICGRREDKLRKAKEKHPEFYVRLCDVASEVDRVSFYNWVTGEFPAVNVLVNNAGIQWRFGVTDKQEWEQVRQELAINLEAPIHLSLLFIPHFQKQARPAIINITSGLAFAPIAITPIYCATKAALHSFTLSLRHQLSKTPIEVIEIIPPAVDTDLGGPGLHTFGVPVDEFADAAMKRLEKGDPEIPYGFAERSSRASRKELDDIFERMNQSTTEK